MEKAVLDLTGCDNHWDMHERFRKDLQFPEHYGKNWDAFWDSMMYDSPVEYIEIRGEHTVSEELRSMLEKLHEILQEVKQRQRGLGWEFDYVIVD